jgi:hypothetical protein
MPARSRLDAAQWSPELTTLPAGSAQPVSAPAMARDFRPAPLQALAHRVQWVAPSQHSALSSLVLQPARR